MNGEIDPEELKKIEEMKKVVLKKILSREAMERLARVRLVKPELANELELYLIQLYQTGKINEEISEEQIKMILERLAERKKFRIIK
ncbi:MAG: DNA-binding protein [Candidatus Aenigmatarchaeota archaeon]